tara:strand:- start:1206 stop:1781 length:576 start_codon:yes stop_codon:yes gene_type:complete
MNSKVNIIADDKGNAVRQSNSNPEFGHVRLVQTRVTFGNSGWVKKSNISTLLHGKLEDLQEMGLESMEFLPGKIVIKEQLEAFSQNDGDRDYKMAGDTGIICCVDGQPIYRKTFFVADATAQDVLVAHDNSAAIKEANGLENNTSFDLNKKTKAVTAEEFGFDDSEEGDDLVSETTDEVEEVEEVEETFEL